MTVRDRLVTDRYQAKLVSASPTMREFHTGSNNLLPFLLVRFEGFRSA